MISAFGFGNGFWNQNLSDEEKLELQEQKDAIKTAIQNNDYETWKAIMEERIAFMKSQLTEENFNELKTKHQDNEQFRIAMQEARESGDFEAMQEIREQFGKGKGMHKRNMNPSACQFAR